LGAGGVWEFSPKWGNPPQMENNPVARGGGGPKQVKGNGDSASVFVQSGSKGCARKKNQGRGTAPGTDGSRTLSMGGAGNEYRGKGGCPPKKKRAGGGLGVVPDVRVPQTPGKGSGLG